MTAPLRFALAPKVATPEMMKAGVVALSVNGCTTDDLSDSGMCHAAMLAASPGNDLLERIVRARDIAGSCQHGTREWLNSVDELYLVLNELGGGHG